MGIGLHILSYHYMITLFIKFTTGRTLSAAAGLTISNKDVELVLHADDHMHKALLPDSF